MHSPKRLEGEVGRQVRPEEVGARDRAHHQGAAAEERLHLTGRAPQRVAEVLGRVAGGVPGAQREAPERHVLPVPQRVEVELEVGVVGGVDPGPRLLGQLARARDEVVVDVGFDRARDAQAEIVGAVEVLGDVAQRIHHHGFAGVGIGDQIARVSQLASGEKLDLGGPRHWRRIYPRRRRGGTVDALDLGSSGRKAVEVRFLSPTPALDSRPCA